MLTLEEQERMAYVQGNIEQAQLFAMVEDAEAHVVRADSASDHIMEAMNSLPGEDFLVKLIDRVIEMSKQRVTKEDVKELANRIEDFQMEIHYNIDYARGELQDALNALKGN